MFRYYDFDDRSLKVYSEALVRLIDFVRDLTVVNSGEKKPPVNIIAHSMGGLIVREAIQWRTRRNTGRLPTASTRS